MREIIDFVKKEDIENANKKEKMVQQMCGELGSYLIKKKKGNLYKLKQLLDKGHEDPIYALQMEFFIHNDTYLKKFHEIARKYGYFYKGDIQNIVTDLTYHNDASSIEKFKKLSFIEDILYREDDQKFNIKTDFGSIVFMSAEEEYEKDACRIKEAAKQTRWDVYKKTHLAYLCHFTALEFISYHPDHFLVTCMCPHIFTSTWWHHSYILTPSFKTVIDFANNIVIEKEMFDLLFEPNDLVKIKQEDLDRMRRKLDMLSLPYDAGKVLSNMTQLERAKQIVKK